MLGLVCIVSILLMAIIGWLRGALTMGLSLLALFLAGILAAPFSFLGAPLARALQCPELLLPIFQPLSAGLILFFPLLAGGTLYLKRRRRNEESRPEWDRPLGAMTGGVWGLFLVLLIFSGINSIARADRAMREAAAVGELRTEKRLKVEKQVREDLNLNSDFYAKEEIQRRTTREVAKRMAHFEITPEQLHQTMKPGTLDPFLEQMDGFSLKPAVGYLSPVDGKAEALLRDLTVVVGDPILFDRFQHNEKVMELLQDETVQALARDPRIRADVQAKRFREVMDNPKLVKLSRDDEVREKFLDLKIDKLLSEILHSDKN